MKVGYILLNGKFHPQAEPLFTGLECDTLNTLIKHSFRAENNEILFPLENYLSILDHLSAFDIPAPRDWDIARFRKDVSRLLNKNHLFLAARVNIIFFKGNEHTSFLLTAEEIPRGFYPLNENGLLIDFYEECSKGNTLFNSFESSSCYLWLSAKHSANQKGKQNLLISNSEKFICEGISVSFGYFVDNKLILPSKETGGYIPPMVKIIAKYAIENSVEVLFKSDITRKDLLDADEVFLIDNCLGIQKVLGLQNRRYYSTKTTLLSSLIKDQASQSLLPSS